MQELLDAVEAVASVLSPEKVQVLAGKIRQVDVSNARGVLMGVFSTPSAMSLVETLIGKWHESGVGSSELAMMLMSASHVLNNATKNQSTELVWTGPTTPFVAPRRTEQALLQVINAAEHTLFVTSFVAYDVSTIVKALNSAGNRGVSIRMLFELSQDQGGNVTYDVIGKMKTLVPFAKLYAWSVKPDAFAGGSVHAKVAVADGNVCFITSANLTGHAMEKNMELGILISGGETPATVERHLNSMVELGIVGSC